MTASSHQYSWGVLEQCGNSRVVETEMQNAECKQCATMSDVTTMTSYQCSFVHLQCGSTSVQLLSKLAPEHEQHVSVKRLWTSTIQQVSDYSDQFDMSVVT